MLKDILGEHTLRFILITLIGLFIGLCCAQEKAEGDRPRYAFDGVSVLAALFATYAIGAVAGYDSAGPNSKGWELAGAYRNMSQFLVAIGLIIAWFILRQWNKKGKKFEGEGGFVFYRGFWGFLAGLLFFWLSFSTSH